MVSIVDEDELAWRYLRRRSVLVAMARAAIHVDGPY
jgi:hypothetical protein